MKQEEKMGWALFTILFIGLGSMYSASCSAYGYDPPGQPAPPKPPAAVIIIPDQPIVPPSPPPPTTPQSLLTDQLYVVRSDSPVTFRFDPEGVVKASLDSGPVKIKGKIICGPSSSGGKDSLDGTVTACRTFKESYVYTLEAVGSGACKLLIIQNANDPAQDIVRTFNVGGTPPIPPIPPPSPTDPLTLALQAAYTSETDKAKADKVSKLIDDCLSVPAIKSSGKVTTLLQLHDTMHTAADLQVGVGGLPTLRKAMSQYIAGKLPSTDGPLTEATWAAATVAYADVAKALKGVK